MAADLKPAYLIAGGDDAKADAAIARLRSRAEREGGPGALESFSPADGDGVPDVDGLIAAIPAMSLTASRRYLLADRLERANAKALAVLAEAIATLPPDLTIVLVERPPAGRDRPTKARTDARAALVKAVEAAGGESIAYKAPAGQQLPRHLVAEASARGFALAPDAARLLIERMGERTVRLANELDRLALWAGQGGDVSAADLDAMVADTSEEVTWALSDAIVERNPARALAASESLATQGEAVTGLIYQAAKRLRAAHQALAELEAGRSPKEVEGRLGMHPYAAKMLLRQVRGGSVSGVRASACAVADLEWWTRGGSDYPEDVARTLSVRRAAGGEG
jgi:DNA polymerase III delta subunit